MLILCVIDGDACVFTEALLRQGHEGGRLAAQQLTKAVADHLTSEDIHVLGRLSFWITIYYNRIGLASVLERHQICTPEQLEAFTMGFSQASPRFLLVDVGYGKDATFTKITGLSRVFCVPRSKLNLRPKNIYKPTLVSHRRSGFSLLVRRSITAGIVGEGLMHKQVVLIVHTRRRSLHSRAMVWRANWHSLMLRVLV